MHVLVNGVRLFFDVEGAKLVPGRSGHAGKADLAACCMAAPASDHSIYKPAYSALADIAQIVYLDHRGNGRSEDGPRESWNLAQWGDDVRAFCDVLGIVDPIVLGASFGGMVALAYATRHPAHPSKLVLISTAAAGDAIWTGAWRCSSASAARKSARWRAAGSWMPTAGRIKPRSTPGEDWPSASICARRATRTLAPPVGQPARCCTGSPGQAARATPSTCSRISTASSARPSCSAARTIRFIRSRARRISRPRCRAHLVRFERFADCRPCRGPRCARSAPWR